MDESQNRSGNIINQDNSREVLFRYFLVNFLLLTQLWELNGQTAENQNDDENDLLNSIFGNNSTEDPTKVGVLSGITPCTCMNLTSCYGDLSPIVSPVDVRINVCADSLDVCCDEPVSTSSPPTMGNKNYTRQVSCGRRHENGVIFKITDEGTAAQFGEFPWMIAILKKIDDGQLIRYKFQNGGSLIHPSVVLTSAHNVERQKASDLVARAGEYDSKSDHEPFPYQQNDVSRIIIHEQYVTGVGYNDIALLILQNPFEFDYHIDVICLPTYAKNFDYARCVASGWGKDKFGDNGTYQNKLKLIELAVVPRSDCQDRLRNTRLGPRFQLHSSSICAGGISSQDTCEGDGGSPLMCPVQGFTDVYEQAGIVSWGISCGGVVPGVYTDVALFRTWIDQQMSSLGLSTEYYNLNVQDNPATAGTIWNN